MYLYFSRHSSIFYGKNPFFIYQDIFVTFYDYKGQVKGINELILIIRRVIFMKDLDSVYDWVDMASLVGGAGILTILIYSILL